jgi:competence protein ComEA
MARSPSERPQLQPRAARASKSSLDGVVNLNDAAAEDLERLPGIGPAKARAIVEHRHTHPFHRVDELTKVKGIGRKTFARLRPHLSIAGPTTLKEAAAQN